MQVELSEEFNYPEVGLLDYKGFCWLLGLWVCGTMWCWGPNLNLLRAMFSTL